MTLALMAGYYVVGLCANICFKEGGTDAAHRLQYFIGGNILGITSTALLMGVYSRMQVNIAMLAASVGTFVLVQATFWVAYHSAVTPLQFAGIALAGIGSAMATARGPERC
jgi:hypothetical protein